MGFFNSNIKKTDEEKIQEIFEKYGLDIENYNETEIKEQNIKNLKQVANDVVGNNWIRMGMSLSFAPADKQAIIGYLSAIFNQNFILIRQNELMVRLLKKIANKK